ncbi:hypothetical protein WICPIJ_009934 [Wickerhamomyces pijperi]|uniref:Uncharacterized protein n=1 Tax=Wickerhamomyces pijperi TaxID=599730 RepID=A0A9P8PIQ8_WICPI|nr:hypothetical protein WICPIJ_009934 [Wickerhamomyces pijperi]
MKVGMALFILEIASFLNFWERISSPAKVSPGSNLNLANKNNNNPFLFPVGKTETPKTSSANLILNVNSSGTLMISVGVCGSAFNGSVQL